MRASSAAWPPGLSGLDGLFRGGEAPVPSGAAGREVRTGDVEAAALFVAIGIHDLGFFFLAGRGRSREACVGMQCIPCPKHQQYA